MQRIIWGETKAKIKIIKWPEAKNGGYVYLIFKNAQGNPRKNARENLVTTMG